jgi:hypothetical protein
MHVLHQLSRDVVRTAALAGVLTLVLMALVLLFPFDGLRPADEPAAAPPAPAVPAAPPAPIVQTGPDWAVRPLAPVTID